VLGPRPPPISSEGDSRHTSRGSHAPPGRSGDPDAGQRAAGGTLLNCLELVGREMRKACPSPRAPRCRPLESCVLRNEPAQFGKGATEKARKAPRRCSTAFEQRKAQALPIVETWRVARGHSSHSEQAFGLFCYVRLHKKFGVESN
jgi:hypothetical protein